MIINMKNIKFILGALLLTGFATVSTSCNDDFLKEDQINAQNISYFKTQSGLDDLITGAYSALGWNYNYSWGYGLYNMGIDEYTDANNEVPAMNGYTTLIPTEGTYIPGLWDNMYNRIEACNVALENLPEFYDTKSANFSTRLGEAYFLRAFCYFELVKTYGAVPMKLKSSNSAQTYFVRDTEEKCYSQIISDLEEAYKLLPTTPAQTGRITKSAAAHYLAKAHLFRASELYRGWNGQYVSADLDAVIKYAQEVVDAHPLAKDFVDLFDFTEPDSANESNSEVVLAAQFTFDVATQGRFGNQAHLCFPSVYQDIAGTKRDISGDREFCYTRTTNYTLDCYDRVNDSRFWKTFITAYGCNHTDGAPLWTKSVIDAGIAPAGAVEGGKRFVGGDVAIRYIVNDAGDIEYEPVEGEDKAAKRNGVMQAPHTFVRYFKGEAENWLSGHGNYGNFGTQKLRFVANSKHRDGSRADIANQFGSRDALIARSAEDVLMKAEAYARQNKLDDAVTELNKLRDRAAYAEGEDRSIHKDGGQAYLKNSACNGKGGGFSADGAIYTTANTYYESNKMEGKETTASTKAAMHLNSVNDIYNSPQDKKIYETLAATAGEKFTDFGFSEEQSKVLNFILNERTRELTGEYHRWNDLARQRQLEIRHKAFNDAGIRNQGTFDPAKHYYRPIPQSFIDGVTDEEGKALSDEAKKAMQNPGY